METSAAEKNYRDEDFYKCFSRLYTDITLNAKAPWMKEGLPERGLAYNPNSGVIFGGINSIILEMRAAQKGYKDSRWLSLHELKTLNIKVKPNEIATPIAYVNKYTPPVNVHPATGERFNGQKPRQRYYFMYNAEQLQNYVLSHDKEFVIGKQIIAAKALNIMQNTGMKDIRSITDKLLNEVVRSVPKEMSALATGITQYRLAQELHIPYRPVLNAEQLNNFKHTKMTTDTLLRTVYQSEVTKDRLCAPGKQLERDQTRTVQKTKQKQHERTAEMERE
ncbi:ArdC family protein [Treponema sp. HNW]|uniref:ArdC-like ssDNA-binding domain-containing protein n=1 Tax=Treponema sp. HNW TaxID=3116654 RepID=UPI003D140AF0